MSLTRRRALAAALTTTAVAATASVHAGGAFAAEDAGPVFPWPGRGGPVAIHAHNDITSVWLLHPRTGRYERTPFASIDISPDGGHLAVVYDDGGLNPPVVGVVSRGAWHLRGEAAVRRLDLPNFGAVSFSPRGSALLTCTRAKGTWFVHRYDLATGSVRTTVLPVPELEVAGLTQWAADSTRYLVSVLDPADPDGPGRLVHCDADGNLGKVFTEEGGIIRQYSPNGSAVIIEPPLPFGDDRPADWKTAKVVSVATGAILARIPTAAADFGVPTPTPLLGWHDDAHVVRYSPTTAETTIEVVAFATGEVTAAFAAPGLNPLSYSVLRTSRWLSGAARGRSF